MLFREGGCVAYLVFLDRLGQMLGRMAAHAGEVFNVGTGIQTTIREVVELAVNVTGERTALNWNRMEHRIWDTDHWVADASKTARILQWKSTVDLAQGLWLTWEWFKDNLHQYL